MSRPLTRSVVLLAAGTLAVLAAGVDAQSAKKTADERGKEVARAPDYKAYLKRRADLSADASAEEHGRLAKWAKDRGLAEESRAHYLVAASLDPTNPRWHLPVGRKVRGNGLFMTDGELAEAVEDMRKAAAANRDWGIALRDAGAAYARGSSKALHVALSKFNEPAAIPALERFGQANDTTVQLFVVNTLRRLQHHEACDALIRHAIYAPDEKVRTFAADALAVRNPTRYVPRMTAWMNPDADPNEVTLPATGLGGRHAIMWAVNTGNRAVVANMTGIGDMAKAAVDLQKAQRGPAFDFRLTNRERTARIAAALEEATGEKFGTDPAKWREWLDKLTDSYTPAGAAVPPPQVVSQSFGQPPPVFISFGVDCFAAGTPVWTRRGLVPVEELVVGDLVWSRDMDDGGQRWQPITRTITRPAAKQVKLTIDGETIAATLGHPFRVKDRKWVFARDLKAGDLVKAHAGYLKVEATEPLPEATAYSIELANYGTYYVGTRHVLVHDNTPVYDLELDAQAEVEEK